MTVLTQENRLAAATAMRLPRVNLLPPEIAEQRAFRKIQFGLGAVVLATVGVVGLLYTNANHSVSSANSDLASAQGQTTRLQSQLVQYRNVTAVYAQAAAAETMLQTAMADEVRYSQLLNDLSLTVPGNVWLKNITYTSAAAGAAPASAGVASAGTFTATAVAFSHEDVALWLESLATLKTYANPYFSSSQEALLGTRKVVNFSSTATVTMAARSGRYNKPVGG